MDRSQSRVRKLMQATLILASLSVLIGTVVAQMTTAIISGTLKDETGAVLPGVSIDIRNLDTGVVRSVLSDEQGRYRAPNLSLGNYEVRAALSGFRAKVHTGIKLTLGREAIVDFILEVGEIQEQVTVTGEAPLVESTTSSVSGLVDDRKIRDLPLNGRSFDQLATLQPLVAPVSRAARINFSNRKTSKISIQGARPDQNSFLLDGTDVGDQRGNTPGGVGGTFLGVETVREFRVEASTYSAEFGRAAGGVITAVTKSGTNDLHGSLFEFHRNSALDAKNFFDPVDEPIPPFKRNQFGFTVGGPVARNKTFFFGSYEGLRDRLGLTSIAVVPNLDARGGFLPNPQTGRLEFVGVDSRVKPYLDLYPLPNGRDFGDGSAERLAGASQRTNENYYVVRIDHNFSDRDLFFGRYTFDDSSQFLPGTFPEFSELEGSRNQYLTLEAKKIISSTLFNTARFGFNRSFTNSVLEISIEIPRELSWFPGEPLFSAGGELEVGGSVTNLADGGRSLPRFFAYNLFEWSDDLNYTRGKHAIKAGVLIKRVQFNGNEGRRNEYEFDGLRNFLENRPQRFRGLLPGSDRNRAWRQLYWGQYVQDDVRMRPGLTLNLGLRHELITGPTEANEKCANLDNLFDPTTRVGCPFFETFKKQFGPRLGFAWDPLGSGRTSVRGGFGIFYDLYFPKVWDSAGNGQPPFARDADIRRPPFPNIGDVILQATPPTPALRSVSLTATPYVMQYSLNLQREIASATVLTVGYAGSRGVHLSRTLDENVAIPVILADGRKFFPPGSQRRNPAVGENRRLVSDANSFFNALLLSVRKSYSGGLQFQVSYTLGKAIDDISNTQVREIATSIGGESMHGYDRKLDRGLSTFNVTHNFVLNYTYDLPVGADLTGIAGKLLAGWQLNGIASLASGTPFSVGNRFDRANQRTNLRNERPDLLPGRSTNPVLGGPDRYFDPAAFELQPAGFFGNLGRNTLIGPGLANFDFSLVKGVELQESKILQFRAEFFNVLNRPNFGLPGNFVFLNATTRIGNAGRITATSTTSRQIQFALKFQF